ncbi:MAG TPA: ribosome-associated translation inhibitor RaiA [Desulfosalsimonadaceae bacterium]|nr:ribosome-associated translation inhibitor RaiA [Desulfosalsimonadaceae bacterium]
MQTSVTFKNIEPSENLKNYVSNKIEKLDKLLDNPGEANVVLSVEKIRHITEIKLLGDRLTLNCREESNDMYSSIDLALDKLEKQLKKNKQKVRQHRQGPRGELKEKSIQEPAGADMAEEQTNPRIRVQNIEYKPMDIEEAGMQLELTPDNFLVFTNARTNRINVIYRRNDGDLGLIQPIA